MALLSVLMVPNRPQGTTSVRVTCSGVKAGKYVGLWERTCLLAGVPEDAEAACRLLSRALSALAGDL